MLAYYHSANGNRSIVTNLSLPLSLCLRFRFLTFFRRYGSLVYCCVNPLRSKRTFLTLTAKTTSSENWGPSRVECDSSSSMDLPFRPAAFECRWGAFPLLALGVPWDEFVREAADTDGGPPVPRFGTTILLIKTRLRSTEQNIRIFSSK